MGLLRKEDMHESFWKEGVSNPNLLINGDFQVWQRGISIDRTNLTGKFYTADRFCAYRSAFAQGLKVEKYGGNEVVIRAMNNFDKDSVFSYTFDEQEVIALRGKTLTFSLKYRTGSLITDVIRIRSFYSDDSVFSPGQDGTGVLGNKEYSPSTSTQTAKLTFTVPMTAKGLRVDMLISIPSAESESYVCTKEWKVEVGDKVTPFIPRLYAEELALCQRYYFQNNWISTLMAHLGNGVMTTISYKYPVRMRATPTVNKLVDKPVNIVRTKDFSVNIIDPDNSIISTKQSGIINNEMIDFQFNCSLDFKDYQIEIVDNAYEFDAEIY